VDLKNHEKHKLIETYCGHPLDEKGSFNVYIGRNIPKQSEESEQKVVTQEELDKFFDLQEIFEGLTRISCKGMWKGEQELSEMIIIFDVSLRDIMTVFLEYMDFFSQEAVYIDILNSKQIKLKRGQSK
jgi:hypothetical protein